jgi:NhaP-type Na+/H+ or K+/H+ antiporter
LAPTDAALGLAIFNNPKVPTRIRRALNVESGFNDGIAAPFVTLFVAFAVSQEAGQENWLAETVAEIGFALLIGVVVGVAGGWVLQQAAQRGWTAPSTEQFAVLGLALASYFSAVAIHGNGFIAAFIAGLFFVSVTKERFHEPTEFTESLSSFLSLAIWIIFGAVLVDEAFAFTSDWRPITYAVLSLTIVRMIPVAVSMLGTGLRTDTVLMMGWFGPRGLASVVFTLLALIRFEDAGRPIEALVTITTWTILLSVFAHGLSAQPLANWYARRLATAPAESPELADVPELRARHASRLSPHDDSP